jgi:NAD(P)-dependent dehydrogenase (short-subunit alcohol dehydrogenase family)
MPPDREARELEGRVIAITGGSSGIGLATAEAALRRGARVAILARDRARLDASLERLREVADDPGHVIAVAGDAVEQATVEELMEAARRGLGGLDGFVAAAGSTAPFDLLTGDLGEWRGALDGNLTSALVGARAAAAQMASGGSIVLLGSMAARRTSAVSVAYGAAKAGIVVLSRALALELAGRGVRVNCVVPGFVDTPMTQLGFRVRAEESGEERDRIRGRVEEGLPLGRLGEPAEIAEMIAFVLSPRASYLTGAEILVDGGELAAFGRR